MSQGAAMVSTTAHRDYYEVLGVPPDADDKAIKDAFRRLAFKYHPDRSTEPDAEDRFKEIAEAYAVLSDPSRRSEYDARGFAGVSGLSPEDLFADTDFGDLFGMFGFDAASLFERLLHPGAHRGPRRGRDVEVLLSVPLATVMTGGEETVTLRRASACATCGGSGARAGTHPRTCPDCAGTGQRTTRRQRGGVVLQQVTTCSTCAGRGTVIDERCPDCRGTGAVDRYERLSVRIPAGIEEGTALRIPGHGMPSGVPGGAPGDAYVVVTSAPDQRFVRRGADLWEVEDVDVPDAVLGTKRTVPTLGGEVTLEVPPGTQPGTVLRLARKGLPRTTGRSRGDLFVTVNVRIPERLGAAERDLWERLRNHGGEPGASPGRRKWRRRRKSQEAP